MTLKVIRLQKKITLERLAAETGLAVPHLNQIERGLILPRPETRQKIEDVLGVKINWHKQRLQGTFSLAYLENQSDEEYVAGQIYRYIKTAQAGERKARFKFLTGLIREIEKTMI